MLPPRRYPQAAYAADLKSEAQRYTELQQTHEQLQQSHTETAGKLKRLHRDHTRLLDRKLECDRRITSLQFKLKERASADKAGGACAPPTTTADAAAREHQQAALAAHAALALVRAEQDARRAAEKKVCGAAGTHCPVSNQRNGGG